MTAPAKPFALITWNARNDPRWVYYETREQAQAAAPSDRPFTIADTTTTAVDERWRANCGILPHGYKAHVRRGEQPCEACRQAYARYKAGA